LLFLTRLVRAVPRVKKVVYSTCSVHEEENERVVRAILDAHPHVTLARALPQWPRRGRPLFPGAENCVRTLPLEDKTIGFFVACFEIKPATTSSAQSTGAKRKRLDADGDDNDNADATTPSGGSTAASTASSAPTDGAEEKQKIKNRNKKRRKRKNKKSKSGGTTTTPSPSK
jgi:putative methyltransferase